LFRLNRQESLWLKHLRSVSNCFFTFERSLTTNAHWSFWLFLIKIWNLFQEILIKILRWINYLFCSESKQSVLCRRLSPRIWLTKNKIILSTSQNYHVEYYVFVLFEIKRKIFFSPKCFILYTYGIIISIWVWVTWHVLVIVAHVF